MYYRDTWVEVDLDRISENVRNIKKYSGYEHLFAVVKANGYGHGDIEVAKSALESGADMFSVAFLDEALFLRRAIKNAPILVMGAVRSSDLAIAAEHDIQLTVQDLHWAEAIKNYHGKPVSLHLKIDTGMNRLGFSDAESLLKALNILTSNPCLVCLGIFTHFANADDEGSEECEEQLVKFKRITSYIDLGKFKFVHFSNSAALLRYGSQAIANTGRMGIAMYGLSPSSNFSLPFNLYQAFSLHSRIVQIKQLKRGDKVGYGGAFVANENMCIGTIPIGYADGWLRCHEGREVEIKKRRYRLVGRICMDQCMVKIDDNVGLGDRVDLINDSIKVDEIAREIKTINYEVVCCISDRVPRIYKKNNRFVSYRNDRFSK